MSRHLTTIRTILAPMSLTLIATADLHGQCTEGCDIIHTFVGEAAGDQLGWVSNCVGDLDGDRVNDLVLTAPTNDAGGSQAGRIYAYSGASGAELFTVTGQAGWSLGFDANEAGDINGDGTPDIIVGAPASGTGRALIVSGVDGAVLHTFLGENAGDQFGYRVHGGGDFNGDGHPDVIIGAPTNDDVATNAGKAYIYNGQTFALLCSIDGPTISDQFGSGVTFIGDVTGDGRDDVAIGAQNAGNGTGLAYVYSWNAFDLPPSCKFEYTIAPGAPAQNFGLWFMNGGHDVDGDGVPDVYVNDYAINRAHIRSGIDGSTIHTLTGNGNGQFGIGRIVEDINGDGHADMILAAWISSEGAPSAGKAFIYSGIDGSVLETFTHNIGGAGFGFDANGMGDVDGDGRHDWLVTAAQDNANGGRGIAYLIAGTVDPGSLFGDLDGDGMVAVSDLLQLLAAWGPCPGCPEDLDESGDVGVSDLLLLLSLWS